MWFILSYQKYWNMYIFKKYQMLKLDLCMFKDRIIYQSEWIKKQRLIRFSLYLICTPLVVKLYCSFVVTYTWLLWLLQSKHFSFPLCYISHYIIYVNNFRVIVNTFNTDTGKNKPLIGRLIATFFGYTNDIC